MSDVPSNTNEFPEIVPQEHDVRIRSRPWPQASRAEALLAVIALWVALYFGREGQWVATSLILAFIGLRIWVACCRFRWDMLELSASTSELLIIERGRQVRSIPYSEIASYQFGSRNETFWLRITLRTGEVGLEIPNSHHVIDAARAKRSLVRQMGPRLPKDVWKPQPFAPGDEVQDLAYEYYYNPPVINMQPGMTYRYKCKKELRKLVLGNQNVELLVFLIALPFMFHLPKHLDLMSIMSAVMMAWYAARITESLIPSGRLAASLDDRISIALDGSLIVIRKKKWRSYRNPQVAEGWRGSLRVFDAPVIRYGWGLRAYYFDPRFIEEDT